MDVLATMRRGAWPKLPYDTEVEYLDSSDGAYLKIVGYTPSDDNIIHGHWKVVDVIKDPFGCLNFAAVAGYGRFFATEGLNWPCNGEKNVVFDGVNKLVNGEKYPENIYTASASGDFWIFGRSDTGKVGGGRIYSWEEKTPDGMGVIDLIPVRVGDVGYMYDRVSGQLFGNSGTGAFIVGPDKQTFTQNLGVLMPQREVELTARDYVQDGLIAMWDGIENAGWGQHNANAPVWKDLIGGVGDMHFFVSGDGSKTPSTIPLPNEGMCYVSNGETICAAEDVNEFLKTKNNGEYTFEITQIFRERFGLYAQRPILSYINTENITGYYNEKYRYVTIGRNMAKPGTTIDNFPHCSCLSICSQPSKGWFYADAELQNTVESSAYSYNYSLRGDSFENGRMPLKLFSNWVGVATTKEYVRISSVRIYDKILSASEITANYVIDKARFKLP